MSADAEDDKTGEFELNEDLPPGWTRKVVQRQSGKSAGKYDTYIYSPSGQKFRSRQDLQRYLDNVGSELSATQFDFNFRGKQNFAVKAQIKSSLAHSELTDSQIDEEKVVSPKTMKSPNKRSSSVGKEKLLVKMNFKKFKVKQNDEMLDDNGTDLNKEILMTSGIDDCLSEFPEQNESSIKKTELKWNSLKSPYNLIQERLYHDPWSLLISTIFLQRTEAALATEKLFEFLKRWPTPDCARKADYHEIAKILQPLCLHKHRAKIIVRFSDEYLTKKWKYPSELHGIGKFGDDCYRIFCTNEWKQVKPDDLVLKLYHRWLWAQQNDSSVKLEKN
ncbi:Methyl-CpG-binding domain protein 4 [Chamberlinius hualienensis]